MGREKLSTKNQDGIVEVDDQAFNCSRMAHLAALSWEEAQKNEEDNLDSLYVCFESKFWLEKLWDEDRKWVSEFVFVCFAVAVNWIQTFASW